MIKRFVSILVPVYAILRFIPFGLEWLTTRLVSLGLSTLGVIHKVSGVYILANNGVFLINRDCTGIMSISVLVALLFSSDICMEKKVFYSVFGSIFLVVWNIIRITISILGPFQILHFTLWFISTFLIVGIYYLALLDSRMA